MGKKKEPIKYPVNSEAQHKYLFDTDGQPKEPWERTERETNPAWEAFQVYRDSGPCRNLTQTARILDKSRTLMVTWSKRHSWTWRAHMFDRYLDQEVVEAHAAEARAMAKRHAAQAASMSNALMVPVRALLERIERDPKAIDQLGDADLAELAMLCTRMANSFPQVVNVERLARGEATEIIKQFTDQGGPGVLDRIHDYKGVFDRLSGEEPASSDIGSDDPGE